MRCICPVATQVATAIHLACQPGLHVNAGCVTQSDLRMSIRLACQPSLRHKRFTFRAVRGSFVSPKLRKPVAARAQRAHVGFLSINTSLAGKLFKGFHTKAHSGPRFLLHFLIKGDIIVIESRRGKKKFKWIIIKYHVRAWAIDVVPEPKARILKRTLLK